MGLSACPLVLVHSVLHIHTVYYHSVGVCLSLQGCQSDGKEGWWGIASVASATIGDVTTSVWTFTMSYSNSQQGKALHVTYTLAASGATQYTFTSESPPNTYVS